MEENLPWAESCLSTLGTLASVSRTVQSGISTALIGGTEKGHEPAADYGEGRTREGKG